MEDGNDDDKKDWKLIREMLQGNGVCVMEPGNGEGQARHISLNGMKMLIDEDDTYIMMKCLYVVTFLLIFWGGKIILAGGKIILAVNSEYHYY